MSGPGFCLAAAWCFLALAAGAGARDRAPEWLAAAAAVPVPDADKDAPALVLLDEGLVQGLRNGTLVTRTRYAVRVLTNDGRKHAIARVGYLSGSSEVKSLQAWLIEPGGEVTGYGRREAIDLAVHRAALELYGEQQMKLIDAGARARPGTVFGFEAEVAEKTILTQRLWRFQNVLPVVRSSCAIELPAGWNVEARIFNHAPVSPAMEGKRWTWTLAGLRAAQPEPMGPPADTLIPWMAANLIPPDRKSVGGDRLGFGSWEEIAAFFSPRYDAAAAVDATIRSQADALTVATTTPWEKIRALCRYVQKVNYIFIQLDAANAGGMIPRPAARVLQCNYGDCKDKATLLRALLASRGVTAWPLIVAVGGESGFHEDWPSPLQFNHCILAIQVDASVAGPAVLTHPRLGRLLIFDPTDEFTPAGLLLGGRLAARGLLLAGADSGLITLPEAPPEDNRLERRVTARLDQKGDISGTIHEEFFGEAATPVRAERYREGEAGFPKLIEKWLGATLPAPRAVRVETRDAFEAARFVHETDFSARGYGKLMQDKLIVFKPVLVARRHNTPLRKGPRTQPVVLNGSRYTERAEIELPDGYVVDEIIKPAALETAFGRYQARAVAEGRRLIFERTLDLRSAEIPAADYEQVRVFFEKILQNEQSPVVLRRE